MYRIYGILRSLILYIQSKNRGRETGGRRFDGGFDRVGLIHHEEHEGHEEGFL
jgi:hypothetical protein